MIMMIVIRMMIGVIIREEYEETLMNQRKMFDDEIQELNSSHSRAIEKLKKFHADEKQRLEQQLACLKEGGAAKDSLRGTIQQCMCCLKKFYLP